ncbi:MAG TPA: hypothetical protein VGM88_14510 [Kofleriaceae bacterium]
MRVIALAALAAACGSSSSGAGDAHVADSSHEDTPGEDAGRDALGEDAGRDAPTDPRDTLLQTYLAYLQAHPGPQSQGLDGANLADVCALWTALQPSGRDVYLTITARLGGSHMQPSGDSLLSHVTALYRIAGGDDATQTDPGSCGNGEANRMIMHMDEPLHDAFAAVVVAQGGTDGDRPMTDILATGYWRDSHDAGGPHAPFDDSAETNDGGPRGQTQFFADPTSAAANAALGREDLEELIDPLALEMDQDYDCFHNSNPDCSYQLYGPSCFPETTETGLVEYETAYGVIDTTWKPAGC